MKLIEIHDEIFNRIEKALGEKVPVYDYLPEDERPPWVVLGKMVYNFPDTLASATAAGYVVTQKIHIVTEAEAKDFAIQIKKRIFKALEDGLKVEGLHILRQRFTGGEVSETEDRLYYAEVDFELWLQE